MKFQITQSRLGDRFVVGEIEADTPVEALESFIRNELDRMDDDLFVESFSRYGKTIKEIESHIDEIIADEIAERQLEVDMSTTN